MDPDPIIEKMLTENPLIRFSGYTDIQSKTVRTLGQEILRCLEAGITADPGNDQGSRCDSQTVNRAYGLFWLWILGAYEVVRTMCQAKACFSTRVASQLMSLKQKLAVLRMPFAKQELPGKKAPVRAEPSIYGIRCSPPDLEYAVDGQVLSVRKLIDEWEVVFSGISRSDVLADHRATYGPQPRV